MILVYTNSGKAASTGQGCSQRVCARPYRFLGREKNTKNEYEHGQGMTPKKPLQRTSFRVRGALGKTLTIAQDIRRDQQYEGTEQSLGIAFRCVMGRVAVATPLEKTVSVRSHSALSLGQVDNGAGPVSYPEAHRRPIAASKSQNLGVASILPCTRAARHTIKEEFPRRAQAEYEFFETGC